jgi:hypothetical protein
MAGDQTEEKQCKVPIANQQCGKLPIFGNDKTSKTLHPLRKYDKDSSRCAKRYPVYNFS